MKEINNSYIIMKAILNMMKRILEVFLTVLWLTITVSI